MPDDPTEILTEYERRFGDLPSSRSMSDDALANLFDLCKNALERGSKLTAQELGLSPDVPSGAVS